MSISAISGFSAQALYANRPSSSGPTGQTQAPPPPQSSGSSQEINAGHDGDADDVSTSTQPVNTYTTAGAQAAYASN
ncbi:hypothetical+protein [Methylocapsa aurea]|jgi:hypothetical protein|uniref:hypothetical protein n=1 Tax=Methylocapsa aurea TaxID=663610 RepID=UPI003D1887F1